MARTPTRLVACSLVVLLGFVLAGCGSGTGSGEFQHYVALGDSYTSAPLVPVTDMSDGCHQSTGNYPHRLAKRLGIKDLDDRSCGGADTSSMTRSQWPGIDPQFDALDEKTNLVTIGIGGNEEDIFGNLAVRCTQLRATDPEGSPCSDAVASLGKAAADEVYTTIAKRVTATIEEIPRRAPNARLIVVGYPQPFPSSGTCSELPLAPGDYAYAAGVIAKLNAILKSAAEATGATWVDVVPASKGHDICSDDPWINGDRTDPEAALAYHPFANEQAAVAKLIAKTLEK